LGSGGKYSLMPIWRMPATSALLPSTVIAMPAKTAACSPAMLSLTQAMRQLRPARSSPSMAWSR